MDYIISGIQQIGIGIPDVHAAWKWYRQQFGMDIPIFEEAAEANLMLPYTGGKPHQRHAVLAVNLQGGGGFEIWQYTSREPQLPAFEPQLGDLGLFVARIKSRDVAATYRRYEASGQALLGPLQRDPADRAHFFVRDPYDNLFQVVEGDDWFSHGKHLTGGPAGVMIGVTDIERARKLYTDILGYDQVIYDETGTFVDLNDLPGGEAKVRRVLLTHRQPREGGFSRLIGQTSLELVSVQGRKPRKIFENRFWGDRGFIHLCFDIKNMDALRSACEQAGFPFTVDSAEALGKEFDMGEAAGLFSYIEDPDGTLIEFVETLKIPILKQIGWYLNLRNRPPRQPLPNWMLKALAFNRVKD